MRDFLRVAISEGDRVVYFQGGRYDSVNECIVEKVNPKMLRVRIIRSSRHENTGEVTNVDPYRCVRVGGPK